MVARERSVGWDGGAEGGGGKRVRWFSGRLWCANSVGEQANRELELCSRLHSSCNSLALIIIIRISLSSPSSDGFVAQLASVILSLHGQLRQDRSSRFRPRFFLSLFFKSRR